MSTNDRLTIKDLELIALRGGVLLACDPGQEPREYCMRSMAKQLADTMRLLKEAADHIDSVCGARGRPTSDSGELVGRMDKALSNKDSDDD